MDWEAIDKAIEAMPPTMNVWTAPGEKVIFTGRNGHDWQQVAARKKLEIGKEYTVDYCVVHRYSSKVHLQEVPDDGFNSVMFSNVGEPKEIEDRSRYAAYIL